MRENVNLDGSQRVYIPDQILQAWDRQMYAPDGDEGFDDFGATALESVILHGTSCKITVSKIYPQPRRVPNKFTQNQSEINEIPSK